MVPRVLAKRVQQGGGPAGTATKPLERLREPRFQEFAQLGRRLELRNRFQFLERRCERIRETPDCSRFEIFVLWLEIKLVDRREVFGRFQLALDKSLVDDHFRCDIREFTSLPGLYLFAHGLEVALHPVDADRDTVDQRERL